MTLSFHYQPSLKSISNPSIIPLQCRPSNILGSAIKMYCKVLSIAIVTMTRYSPCFELGRVCPDQAHVATVLVVDKTAAEESSELEAVWSCLKLFEGSADVSNTLCRLSINLTNTNTDTTELQGPSVPAEAAVAFWSRIQFQHCYALHQPANIEWRWGNQTLALIHCC